jgi:hypothetical protein
MESLFLEKNGPKWMKIGKEFFWKNKFFDVERVVLVESKKYYVCHQDHTEALLKGMSQDNGINNDSIQLKHFFCFYFNKPLADAELLLSVPLTTHFILTRCITMRGYSSRFIKPPRLV